MVKIFQKMINNHHAPHEVLIVKDGDEPHFEYSRPFLIDYKLKSSKWSKMFLFHSMLYIL